MYSQERLENFSNDRLIYKKAGGCQQCKTMASNDQYIVVQEKRDTAAVPPRPPASPHSKGRKAKRSVNADGFTPPSSLLEKRSLPVLPRKEKIPA
ncbi:hypothetical protein TNCV_157601 [Trichonephila clavipes]|nr:hypothetical protein TNCV_157601 [Trichonephila clavipes]